MTYWMHRNTTIESVEFYDCDFSDVYSMSNMFSECSNLRNVNISNCETGNVSEMYRMFADCKNLRSVNISNCETRNVTYMSEMFSGCSNLSDVNISGFDTGNVKTMYRMFADCNGLSSVDVSGFDTAKVTNMGYMFEGCNKLNSVDVSDFDTSNVTTMTGMFLECSSLASVDVSGFDTGNVVSMSNMFDGCSSLKSVDVSSFDTSNVTTMYRMFAGCSSLTSIDVSSFDTRNVSDVSGMFYECSSLAMIKTPKSMAEGQDIVLPYVFYDVQGNSVDAITSEHCNMSLVKEYVPEYTITYQLDGGTNATDNPPSYNKLSDTIALKAPLKTGYTFIGWYPDNTYSSEITEITAGSTGNVEVYAKWTPNKYTVKFEGNGADDGGMDSLNNREYDMSYFLTANSYNREGYIFLGWNTEADGSGNIYADGANVRNLSDVNGETVILYAQWQIKDYIITYKLDGGTNADDNPVAYNKMSDTIILKVPAKTGYSFAGWYTDNTYSSEIKEIPSGSTGNVEVYANWTPNKYTVKFDGNGATIGKMNDLRNREYDTAFKLTVNAYKKTGYQFIGWNTKENGSGIRYNDKTNVKNLTSTNGETITLYAQWIPNKYTIKFNKNAKDAKGTMKSITSEYDKSYKLAKNSFKRTGYTFAGWSTTKSGKVKFKNNASVKSLTAENGNTITLYAKWTANKYTIKFNKNAKDATGKMKNMTNRQYGKSYKLTKNTFKRKGYSFKGWSTTKKGKVKYKNAASVKNLVSKNKGSVTLYAQWKKK